MLEFLKKIICNESFDSELSVPCASCIKVDGCHIIEAAIDNHDVDVHSFSCSMAIANNRLKITRGDIDD